MARALIIKFHRLFTKGAVKVLITHNHVLTQKTTLFMYLHQEGDTNGSELEFPNNRFRTFVSVEQFGFSANYVQQITVPFFLQQREVECCITSCHIVDIIY